MSYQVIARKWRPQTFSEVVFQDHVSRTIQNSITQGRVTHAYLFSGPRGVGKTTMARILAKALNCVEGPTPQPCGVCENCVEIKQGISFDVIEIDGASNNGVDNIRELRENVNFAPAKSRYKIYIIDEVHMVTTQAFNALLKTLEEPPPHVIFIFATTEMHKIPETILSRCQKYFFKKIPVESVVEHLASIVKKEGYRISDNALFPVARAADGSMRDAQSLLEQVISFSGASSGGDKEISEEDALSIMGVVPTESYARVMDLIADDDPAGLMAEVEKIVSMGIDISGYSAGLVDIIRSLRLILSGADLKGILTLSPAELKSLSGAAVKFSDEELSRLFSLGAELIRNLRFSGNDRVYLEMTLLDMVSVKKSPSVAGLIAMLHGAEESSPESEMKKGKGAAPEAAPLNINAAWDRFVEGLRKDRDRLYYMLKPMSVMFRDDTLTLKLSEDFKGDVGIPDEDSLKSISQRFSRLYGSNVKVEFIPPAVKTEKPDAADEPGGSEEKPPVKDAEMIMNPEKDDYNVESHAVNRIQDAFHGQIIK